MWSHIECIQKQNFVGCIYRMYSEAELCGCTELEFHGVHEIHGNKVKLHNNDIQIHNFAHI